MHSTQKIYVEADHQHLMMGLLKKNSEDSALESGQNWKEFQREGPYNFQCN